MSTPADRPTAPIEGPVSADAQEPRGLLSEFDISRQMEADVDRVLREAGLLPDSPDLVPVRVLLKLAWVSGAHYGGEDATRLAFDRSAEIYRSSIEGLLATLRAKEGRS